MKRISYLCPSRGRPKRFSEMAQSVYTLAAHPERIEILLRIDHDDSCVSDYVDEARKFNSVSVTVGDRISVPRACNELAMKGTDILMIGTDDILIRTKGWDAMLDRAFSAFNDGLGLVYTNCGRDKIENFAVTRRWVDLVGNFLHPEYEHFSSDEHAGEIARRIGRAIFLPELITEHMHFKYRKAVRDDTYASKRMIDARGKSMSERDQEKFKALAGERDAAVERLQAALGTPWL